MHQHENNDDVQNVVDDNEDDDERTPTKKAWISQENCFLITKWKKWKIEEEKEILIKLCSK